MIIMSKIAEQTHSKHILHLLNLINIKIFGE